jgi:hypothetical protein
MNHKHSPTDLFPTWYKSIDPVVDAATVANRITAIGKFLEDESTDTWFNIVKLALGIPGVDTTTISGLESELKGADINFPLVSNENLLHVLAQISLCFLFESENNAAQQVAMALSNAVFFGQFDKSPIPFYEYAREFLSQPVHLLDSDIETDQQAVVDALDAMEASETEILMDYTDQIALLKTVNHLFDSNKKIREESNILWWLFGQYSTIQENYFTVLGAEKMILSAALELAELNISENNLPSARHLLQKALVISNDNKPLTAKVKLSTVIDDSPGEVKTKMLSIVSNISEFTPCLLALSLSTQFDESALWKSAFKSKAQKADIEKEFFPGDVSYQVYNEIKFLSSLQG